MDQAIIKRIDISISLYFKDMDITMKSLKSPNHPRNILYTIYNKCESKNTELTGSAKKFILESFVKTEAHEKAVEIISKALEA
jgi:hypothetical protein